MFPSLKDYAGLGHGLLGVHNNSKMIATIMHAAALDPSNKPQCHRAGVGFQRATAIRKWNGHSRGRKVNVVGSESSSAYEGSDPFAVAERDRQLPPHTHKDPSCLSGLLNFLKNRPGPSDCATGDRGAALYKKCS